MSIVLALTGHVSPETAYVVADYPYSFKLRCQIRYWLETHPKRGIRFMSQTTNPKRGNVWNAPKASTYAKVAGALYLDEKGHVQWASVTEYTDAKQVREFIASFPAAVTLDLRVWCRMKAAYAHKVAAGAVVWKINGVEQTRTDADKERDAQEAAEWTATVEALPAKEGVAA